MMFSWLKYRSNFISRSVLRQNMEWSKGVIFLMATFWPDGLCSAELFLVNRCFGTTLGKVLTRQHRRRLHQRHPGCRTAPIH
jgi:hypothetical protein